MTLKRTEFLALARISEPTLEMWLSEEWLLPVQQSQDEVYSEADVARAQLIQELTHDLGVNSAGVGVALHLLDQVHGLRLALRAKRRH
jgi:chaperone modulatory protein CbpM